MLRQVAKHAKTEIKNLIPNLDIKIINAKSYKYFIIKNIFLMLHWEQYDNYITRMVFETYPSPLSSLLSQPVSIGVRIWHVFTGATPFCRPLPPTVRWAPGLLPVPKRNMRLWWSLGAMVIDGDTVIFIVVAITKGYTY